MLKTLYPDFPYEINNLISEPRSLTLIRILSMHLFFIYWTTLSPFQTEKSSIRKKQHTDAFPNLLMGNILILAANPAETTGGALDYRL